MKVYERINKLFNTDATLKTMVNWGYMNSVCPYEFLNEGPISVDEESKVYKKIQRFAKKYCLAEKGQGCDHSCLIYFLSATYSKPKN